MTGARVPLPVAPLATLIIATVLAAAGALFFSVTSAHAEIEGPCEATIAGAPVGPLDSRSTDDAIEVDVDDDIVATMSSSQGFASHSIKLQFLGDVFPAQTLEDREDNGDMSFTETVDVSDYATYGVGLYRVSGEATLQDDTTCTGAALVEVTGRNPLATVAGETAAAAVAVGTVGGLASGAVAAAARPNPLREMDQMVRDAFSEDTAVRAERARQASAAQREREGMSAWVEFLQWLAGIFGVCLLSSLMALVLVPLAALTGGGGTPSGGAGTPAGTGAREPLRLPRAPWRPRITLLGIVGGLLAGIGVLVLLQQFAVVYPRMSHLVLLLVIGAVAYGLVLPTIGYTIGWARVNGRIAQLEREAGGGAP